MFLPTFEEFNRQYAKEKGMNPAHTAILGDTQRAYNDILFTRKRTQNTGDISQYVAGFHHKTDYNHIHVGNKTSLTHNNKLLYYTAPNFNKYDKVYAADVKTNYGTGMSGENERKWIVLGYGDNQNSFRPMMKPLGSQFGSNMSPSMVSKILDKQIYAVKAPK